MSFFHCVTDFIVVNAACPNSCSYLGSCNGGTCQCISGFGGNDCSQVVATTSTSTTTGTTDASTTGIEELNEGNQWRPSLLVVAAVILSCL